MSKIFTSAVPLTMVRTVEGSYSNVLQDEQIPGEIVHPDDLKRLVRKGFLVEVKAVKKAAKDDSTEPATDTVEAILAEVGDDKTKAAAALETEKAGKNRSTLVPKLEAIINGS